MSDEVNKARAEFERELRQKRKFTPEEAIGRMAGPGAMKGGSAVSREQAAQNAVGCWLRDHLADPSKALQTVLQRQLSGSALLLNNLDSPLHALAQLCERLLASKQLLTELVRETDVEWGRLMDERPYFGREGAAEHPDDPYTLTSVSEAIGTALKQLTS